jgi:hypothetical protein
MTETKNKPIATTDRYLNLEDVLKILETKGYVQKSTPVEKNSSSTVSNNYTTSKRYSLSNGNDEYILTKDYDFSHSYGSGGYGIQKILLEKEGTLLLSFESRNDWSTYSDDSEDHDLGTTNKLDLFSKDELAMVIFDSVAPKYFVLYKFSGNHSLCRYMKAETKDKMPNISSEGMYSCAGTLSVLCDDCSGLSYEVLDAVEISEKNKQQ